MAVTWPPDELFDGRLVDIGSVFGTEVLTFDIDAIDARGHARQR